MIGEDELRDHLRAATATANVPPLDDVVRRGDALMARHRTRRRITIGAASAFAAVVIVGAAVSVSVVARRAPAPGVELAAPVDLPAGVSPAEDVEGCGGYAELRPREEAGVPRLLPTWLPAGERIEQSWARAEITAKRTCPPVPTALVALRRDGDGSVAAGVRLEGPSTMPYRRYAGPNYDRVTVRADTDAAAVRFPDLDPRPTQLTWTEPDGTSWSLTGYGIVEDELHAVAESLVLQPATGDPVAALPSAATFGLDVEWALDQAPQRLPDEEPYWHAVIDDGATLSIDVHRPLVPTPAIGLAVHPDATMVDVNGAAGIAVANGPTTFLVFDLEPGLQVQVSGAFDLETLARIARSLTAR